MRSRLIIIIVLLISIVTCRPTNRSVIHKFDKALGERYSDALNQAVILFENELSFKYPASDITQSYKSFIADAVTREGDFLYYRFDTLFVNDLYNFLNDKNFVKEIWLTPTIVRVYEGELTSVYKYIDENNDTLIVAETSILLPLNGSENIDSLIKAEYNNVEYNHFGKYHRALKSIHPRDTILAHYIQAKEEYGILPPYGRFYPFHYGNPDYNDYFIKRIILIEFLF
jgi:hypothetical protein